MSLQILNPWELYNFYNSLLSIKCVLLKAFEFKIEVKELNNDLLNNLNKLIDALDKIFVWENMVSLSMNDINSSSKRQCTQITFDLFADPKDFIPAEMIRSRAVLSTWNEFI